MLKINVRRTTGIANCIVMSQEDDMLLIDDADVDSLIADLLRFKEAKPVEECFFRGVENECMAPRAVERVCKGECIWFRR